MKIKKPKMKSYFEILNETRDRTSMGRPTVMLTEKDKQKKRCNRKREDRKEMRGYYD